MSELKKGWSGGACCFKCAYVLILGSKSGYEVKRDKQGAVNDPVFEDRLCLHNPDTIGKGRGDAVRVCDLFELDRERYHDLNLQEWEWRAMMARHPVKGQTTLEYWGMA